MKAQKDGTEIRYTLLPDHGLIPGGSVEIEIDWTRRYAPILPTLSDRAQAIFDANLPIVSDFSNQDAERRFWRVEGFAQVPCGGTHLKRTGEVGAIRLRRRNPGKGRERIEITLV